MMQLTCKHFHFTTPFGHKKQQQILAWSNIWLWPQSRVAQRIKIIFWTNRCYLLSGRNHWLYKLEALFVARTVYSFRYDYLVSYHRAGHVRSNSVALKCTRGQLSFHHSNYNISKRHLRESAEFTFFQFNPSKQITLCNSGSWLPLIFCAWLKCCSGTHLCHTLWGKKCKNWVLHR